MLRGELIPVLQTALFQRRRPSEPTAQCPSLVEWHSQRVSVFPHNLALSMLWLVSHIPSSAYKRSCTPYRFRHATLCYSHSLLQIKWLFLSLIPFEQYTCRRRIFEIQVFNMPFLWSFSINSRDGTSWPWCNFYSPVWVLHRQEARFPVLPPMIDQEPCTFISS
jgi:hypothetical protein